jgi:hypothetical protein
MLQKRNELAHKWVPSPAYSVCAARSDAARDSRVSSIANGFKRRVTLACSILRLTHELSVMRRKLVNLWSQEEDFSSAVQSYLARTRPQDRWYHESLYSYLPDSSYSPGGELEKILCAAEIALEDNERRNLSKINISFHRTIIAAQGERLDRQHQEIESYLNRLRSDEAQLDEDDRLREEKKQEEEAYMQHLERLFRHYTTLLQRLLKILFSFCNFSLLPNRHRPPCSTMPWDILPALVILWGVCWMFYTPPHKSQSDQYNATPYTTTQTQEG